MCDARLTSTREKKSTRTHSKRSSALLSLSTHPAQSQKPNQSGQRVRSCLRIWSYLDAACPATVHVDRRTADQTCPRRSQKHREIGDIFRLNHFAQRHFLQQELLGFLQRQVSFARGNFD